MMCSAQPNLHYKPDNKMPTEKYYNSLTKNCHRYDRKKFNNNNNVEVEDVKKVLVQQNQPLRNGEIHLNVSKAPLNTMPPPPPHKIVNTSNKSMLPLSYNRRNYWKSNYSNGRSLSPLGYDSDGSCKSYGSKGNISEEHGKKH